MPTVGYCTSEWRLPVTPYVVTRVASAPISTTANCGATPQGSNVAVPNATATLSIGVVTGSRAATADTVLSAYMSAMQVSPTAITAPRSRGRRRNCAAVRARIRATSLRP